MGRPRSYYELVQLKENESSAGSWGVLVSVDNIRINAQDSESFFHDSVNTDVGVFGGAIPSTVLPAWVIRTPRTALPSR